MTKIDIFSGFLGAGKTTLIKKLIKEAFCGEQIVIIENEFGEIGIDGGFLEDAGVKITEMNSGCICCSLVGDFSKALKQVIDTYSPERIIIEPSGVGKLSDVINAVRNLNIVNTVLNSFTTVVDVQKAKVYMKNFGEFYNNQIENANCIVLSRTANTSHEKIDKVIELIRTKNSFASIITTDWEKLDGKDIVCAMENGNTLKKELEELEHEVHHHHHEHHHEHDDECDCGCHEHHHHEHDEDCDCGCHEHHEHHHEHGEDCDCGCHNHHADEVFSSIGLETAKPFTKDEIKDILNTFDTDSSFGTILRCKGIVANSDGGFIHFDYVPAEIDIRDGSSATNGKICVIGSALNNEKIYSLFGV